MKQQLPPKLPPTLIITMALQIVAMIWWAASLDMKVRTQEGELQQLDARLSTLGEELNNWEAKTYDRK